MKRFSFRLSKARTENILERQVTLSMIVPYTMKLSIILRLSEADRFHPEKFLEE